MHWKCLRQGCVAVSLSCPWTLKVSWSPFKVITQTKYSCDDFESIKFAAIWASCIPSFSGREKQAECCLDWKNMNREDLWKVHSDCCLLSSDLNTFKRDFFVSNKTQSFTVLQQNRENNLGTALLCKQPCIVWTFGTGRLLSHPGKVEKAQPRIFCAHSKQEGLFLLWVSLQKSSVVSPLPVGESS